MLTLDKYPIDFDSVEKGDLLTQEMLEKITAEKFGTDKFTFKVLALQGRIIDETGYTVKNHGDSLVVLTDEEASSYNDKMFKRFKRGMFHRHKLMQNVDVSQLSDTMRQEHERKVLSQSRYISALRSPKTFEVKIEPTKVLAE